MSAISKIEWTDRTWNPVRGCSVVSPGCVNCYAMKQAHRFSGDGRAYHGLTKQTKVGPQWTGKIRTVPDALDEPLSWRQPARVFVNSMSDLFHEGVPDEFIADVFCMMALSKKHTFQVLTKRPQRMREWVREHTSNHGKLIQTIRLKNRPWVSAESWPMPLPNVWLGVSCEDQQRADERIPLLLQTPAAVRFVSAEPLLGPVDIGCYIDPDVDDPLPALDWVIVGGESGPGARPCHVEWVRSIVGQCQAANVATFVKQLGARVMEPPPGPPAPIDRLVKGWRRLLTDSKGGDPSEWPEDLRVREFP